MSAEPLQVPAGRLRHGMRVGLAILAASLAAAFVAVPSLEAQTCQVNNQASCTVLGDATRSLFITISPNTRLIVGAGPFALPTPGTSALATGFGLPLPIPVTVRSNTAWSVAISASSPTWSAVPGTARQNKPASDLQWGLAAGGPFTGLSTTPTTLQSGNASNGFALPLHLRASFDFSVDVAGSYQLPITLIVTAP